jgi:glycerophosphoryl diester phosphodiesterase
LKQLSAGQWFDEKFADERIPSLYEFLYFVKDKNLLINIEIKSGIIMYPRIEEYIIKAVNEYKIGPRVILSSFNHYALLTCKEIDSSIMTGALYMEGLVEPWEYARNIGADAIHPFYLTVKPELMGGIKKSGIIINPFTVNEEAHMRMMISMGMDGIITDYPDKLINIKRELEENHGPEA